ncbi:MAG TPA: hypothetical protein VFU59_03540 [Candidatus Eisenbacteria bacterium]|nr:hypothetical protein [Candidatus Eisenbacteria bacterium]
MNPTTLVASIRARRAAAVNGLRAGLAAVVLFGALGAADANAQVVRAWTNDTPLDPYSAWRGARVMAMGDLSVAVEDDRNPLTPYGYSGNAAGFLTSRDTSYVEQGTSYRDYFDRFYGRGNSAITRTSSLRVGWLQGNKWAIGADLRYGTMSASRHDLGTVEDRSRFIRDFDISLPDYFIPRVGDRTIGAGVDYPSASVIYARRFRSWFTLGGRFTHRSEQEDRTVLNDPYDFDNESSASEVAGGLLIHPKSLGRKVQLGVYASWTGNTLKGVSSSAFNDDSYELKKPEVAWGAQLVHQYGWLKGIIEGHHHSYDGEQIARVNWAPQFFLNPYPSEIDQNFVFKKRWTSAIVGLRHNEVRSRWQADLPGTPVHIGARYAYYREYQWDFPIEDVLSPMLPLDVRRLGYKTAGGVSVDLPEQMGVVALEVQAAREQRADWREEKGSSLPPTTVPDVTMGEISYRFGAEYKARPWLPLRAGVALRRFDPDRTDGQPPFRGIRLSAGASYHWHRMGLLFDGAWAHEHFRYTPLDPSIEIGKSDEVTVTIQHLF